MNCEFKPDSRIVFVHLHKSGGGTIKAALKHSGRVVLTGGHRALSTYKLREDDLVLGNIRNPYAQYVSLWAYGCKRKGQLFQGIRKRVPHLLPLYADAMNRENFRAWLKLVLSPLVCRRPGIGFYTQRFCRLYGVPDNVDHFIRCENMADDLAIVGIDLSLMKKQVRNRSSHLPYAEYYDAETADLVFQHDQLLFQEFDYPHLFS